MVLYLDGGSKVLNLVLKKQKKNKKIKEEEVTSKQSKKKLFARRPAAGQIAEKIKESLQFAFN